MTIESMLPAAILKANSVDEVSFSTRSGVSHAGYHAEFSDGGRITVSSSQITAVTGASYSLDRQKDEWDLKTFISISKTENATVSNLRFPGDRRDTYNPSEDEIRQFLEAYL